MRQKTVVRLSRDMRTTQIMDAARVVFREKGYDGASIADIARLADIVEGSIYRYFTNKRDLLVKTLEHWYEEMLADYDAHLSGVVGTAHRLRFLVWRHLRTVHESPELCALILHQMRPDPAYGETRVAELNRQYTRRTMDVVNEGIASGEIAPGVSPRLVRDLLYGCAEHRTWHYLRGEGDFDPDAVADEIIAMVLRGLGPESR